MAGSFRFMLGFYPKTAAIESKHQTLLSEFNKIKEVEKSAEFSRYLQLDKLVHSSDFIERKKKLESLTYKGSEEHLKEEEYLNLKKLPDIKFYYKFKQSRELSSFQQTETSPELKEYYELKAFLETPEYKKVFEYMNDKKRFEKTHEFRQLQEFKAMSSNPSIKNYFKFIGLPQFSDFKSAAHSPELEQLKSLEKYMQSPEFEKAKSLPKKEFATSEAFKKLGEYQCLKNSPKIKNYHKLLKSSLYNDYKKLHDSEELKYFSDLKNTVESEAFKSNQKKIESLRFQDTPEFQKLQRFNSLAKSPVIREYFKIKESKQLANYKRIDGSKELSHYEELEKYINSDEFKKAKAYLLDPKKWEKTEDYTLFQEFEQLKKSETIVWYYKSKDLPKYNEFRTWNLVFEDNFDSGKLNTDKWINRYFWGEMLMGESYALPGEKHLFSENNIELNGSTVKLVTKKGKITGKEWNPMFGFFPKEFDYSSGLISTGKSYRQKYGRIEAKVRIPASAGVTHTFWLAGNAMLPQIDIFKFANNKLFFTTFWGTPTENNGINKDVASIAASTFTKDYFIFTLDWSPDKLVWKINNIEVKTQTVGVPEEPLYLVLSSGKFEEGQASLPAKLEIDWVRCYEKAEDN